MDLPVILFGFHCVEKIHKTVKVKIIPSGIQCCSFSLILGGFCVFGTWLLVFLASVENKYLLEEKKETLYFSAESVVLLFTLRLVQSWTACLFFGFGGLLLKLGDGLV